MLENPEVLHSDFLKISAKEAKSFELKLRQTPEDGRLHFKLAYYYFLRKLSFFEEIYSIFRSPHNWLPKPIKEHEEHVLWIIENLPEHSWAGDNCLKIFPQFNPRGYKNAKAIWRRKMFDHPKDLRILSNAASFFHYADPQLAEEILTKALEIDSSNNELKEQMLKIKTREKGA